MTDWASAHQLLGTQAISECIASGFVSLYESSPQLQCCSCNTMVVRYDIVIACEDTYKMIYNGYDAIKVELTRRLGHEPQMEIWEYLVNEDYVREVLEQTAEIDYLEDKYRKLDRIPEALMQPSQVSSDSGVRQIRLRILSDLIAHQAATEEWVMIFREQHLSEGLLKTADVHDWIARKSSEEGPASRYIKVCIPDGHKLVSLNGRITTEPQLVISDRVAVTRLEGEVISYSVPDDQWVRRLPVRHGGTLDKLRLLSKSLARRNKWMEAQATTFVLTDISPVLASICGGIRMAMHQPISSRINMEIDPTLTPEEVAGYYKKIRASLIGSRFRSMSEKHLRLAEFYGGHKPEGKTWTALMDSWNRIQVRDWKYKRYETFARDCKRAWERLTGRDLLKFPEL